MFMEALQCVVLEKVACLPAFDSVCLPSPFTFIRIRLGTKRTESSCFSTSWVFKLFPNDFLLGKYLGGLVQLSNMASVDVVCFAIVDKIHLESVLA